MAAKCIWMECWFRKMENGRFEMLDIVVIGGGPAGLTAMLYLLRARMTVALVEKGQCGGQILYSEVIENYPGVGAMSGLDLMLAFRRQLDPYDPNIIKDEVTSIIKENNAYRIVMRQQTLRARAVIVASGARPRPLGIPGEQTYVGRGVSYCATCDAPLFVDRQIVVVGGGDTAVKEALYLSKFASRIYVVHRRDKFRAERVYQERLLADPKISVLWNCVVTSIDGDDLVRSVTIQDRQTQMLSTFMTDGVFIFVGIEPTAPFIDCDKDSAGFITTTRQVLTSWPGVFVCGDVRQTALRQVATAVGDGAMAATSSLHYLESLT